MSQPYSPARLLPAPKPSLWSRFVAAADDPLSWTSTVFFLANFALSGYVVLLYLLHFLAIRAETVVFGWALDPVFVLVFGFNGWTGWSKREAVLKERERKAEEKRWSERG